MCRSRTVSEGGERRDYERGSAAGEVPEVGRVWIGRLGFESVSVHSLWRSDALSRTLMRTDLIELFQTLAPLGRRSIKLVPTPSGLAITPVQLGSTEAAVALVPVTTGRCGLTSRVRTRCRSR